MLGFEPSNFCIQNRHSNHCTNCSCNCTDSFSTSNLCSTILNPGSAQCAVDILKRGKYSQLVADFELVPVDVETSGFIDSAGCSLLNDIDRRISMAINDPGLMTNIFQLISVVIIRGNALAITASPKRYAQELVERHCNSKWSCIALLHCFIIHCDDS